jgi:hypothetical protein
VKHRIEELIHERGLQLMDKYPTIEQARTAAWNAAPELKRVYYDVGLVPVSTARKDAALGETCRRLGVSLDTTV